MKYSIIVIFLLFSSSIFSQAAIGTTNPHSSAILDLTASNKALLITRVAKTSAVVTPTNGMIIYDISSKCIKSYENGAWTGCLSGTNSNSADVVVDCDINGFQGSYFNNIAFNATNKYSVTVTNNTFTTLNISFATSDLVLSGVTGVSVTSVSPSGSQTFTAGQSRLIEYTLSGTPSSTGVLLGTWTKSSLKCGKTIEVVNTPVASINCAGATTNNTLYSNESVPTNTTTTIPYVGNLAVAHTGQVVTSTGVTGLTATLAAGNFVVGNGTLAYTITGTPSGSGTANFAIAMGARTCSLAVTINPPTSFTSCDVNSLGTMTINTPYTAGSVTQTVRLNVTKLGTYSINTNTVNNLSFSASGTFTQLGTNDVILVGTGTPNGSGYLTFTANLTGTAGTASCNFTRYVKPTSASGGLPTINTSGDCNGPAIGTSDLKTLGWQDTSVSVYLTGGNYSFNFNANITVSGRVYSGIPTKKLEGRVLYRFRDASNNIYLLTDGTSPEFSTCNPRSVGFHSASGNYSGSANSQTLPAGTYVLQVYGESSMNGCGNTASDSWGGCGININSNGTWSLNAQ